MTNILGIVSTVFLLNMVGRFVSMMMFHKVAWFVVEAIAGAGALMVLTLVVAFSLDGGTGVSWETLASHHVTSASFFLFALVLLLCRVAAVFWAQIEVLLRPIVKSGDAIYGPDTRSKLGGKFLVSRLALSGEAAVADDAFDE